MLSEEEYEFVTSRIPIVCVDAVLYDVAGKKIGLIIRATGSETNRYTLIGGRVNHGESLKESMGRHLKKDLNINDFTYYKCAEEKPVHVHQYIHGDKTPVATNFGFDPTKNAIALTYILTTNDYPNPRDEAREFAWLDIEEYKNLTFGYGQDRVVKILIEYLFN